MTSHDLLVTAASSDHIPEGEKLNFPKEEYHPHEHTDHTGADHQEKDWEHKSPENPDGHEKERSEHLKEGKQPHHESDFEKQARKNSEQQHSSSDTARRDSSGRVIYDRVRNEDRPQYESPSLMDKRGHHAGDHYGDEETPQRHGGPPIRSMGHGPLSHLFNTVAEAHSHTRQMLNEHYTMRSQNLTQKAAHQAHVADTHHLMANVYHENGQHDLANEARARGDKMLAKQEKTSAKAQKNFRKLPKYMQHNNANSMNRMYHGIRSMDADERHETQHLAQSHSDYAAGHRPTDPEEIEHNRRIKNKVMGRVVNHMNAVRTHSNFDHPLNRLTPKGMNFSKHKGAAGTVTTQRWGNGKDHKHDLTYAPSREPGFEQPHLSNNLAY